LLHCSSRRDTARFRTEGSEQRDLLSCLAQSTENLGDVVLILSHFLEGGGAVLDELVEPADVDDVA
jgi:hypothetical protein